MTEASTPEPPLRDLALRAQVRKALARGRTVAEIVEKAACASEDIEAILGRAAGPTGDLRNRVLAAIGSKKGAAERLEIFVAWGTRSESARVALAFARDECADGIFLNVPCLDPDQELIFSGIVQPGIESAHRLIAILDLPNPNVTFELGYAFARGLSCSLCHMSRERPLWLRRSVFSELVHGFFTNGSELLPILEQTPLRDSRPKIEWSCQPRPSGLDTLVLCPEQGMGTDFLATLKRRQPEWRFQSAEGWPLDGCEDLLEGVGRVIWIITPDDGAEEAGECRANANLGFLAGMALASDRKLAVWRQRTAPEISDVGHLMPEVFIDHNQLATLAAKLPALTAEPAREREPSVLELWQRHAREHHDRVTGRTAHGMGIVVPIAIQRRPDRGRPATATAESEAEAEDWAEARGERTLGELLATLDARQDPVAGIILIGQPGAGKTTTMRQLAWTAVTEQPTTPVLYLHAARLAEKSAAAALAEDLGIEPQRVTEAFLESKADRPGPVWLLVDGWDEIGPGQGEEAAKKIRALASLDQVRLVLASRPVGEPEKTFTAFRPFELRPLSRESQLAFLVGVLGSSRGEELHEKASNQAAIAELMSSPLVLDLLAELCQAGKPVPRRRSELYEEAIAWFLERPRHRPADGPPCPAHWAPIEAGFLLEQMALVLHRDHPGREAWSEKEVVGALDRALEDVPRLEDHLAPWPDRMSGFIREIGRLSGILGPSGGPHQPWSFPHRSFREFMTAAALARRGAEVWRPFLDRLDDEDGKAHWAEVFVFLAGQMTGEEQEDILESLLASHPDLLARALLQAPGLDPATGLGLFFRLEAEHQDGDLLVELIKAWASDGQEPEALRDRLMTELLATNPDDDRLQRAALTLYALEGSLGVLDEAGLDDFFRSIGRPRRPDLLVDARATWTGSTWLQEAPRPLAGDEVLLASLPPEGGTIGFRMVSEEGVGDSDEWPAHQVRLEPFRLARTPITKAQYQAFEDEQACSGGPGHPVSEVSWWRAWLFCRWLGGDLPTEAQWEAACRAGTTTAYSFGDDVAGLRDHAWYDDNSQLSTQPVGTRRANPWGLHDLHGNVWEWCRDWFGSYEDEDVDEPTGPRTGTVRVLRGGSCWFGPVGCRSAYRFGSQPWYRDVDFGFRVALPPPPDRPSSLDSRAAPSGGKN
ncbi:MAG: SUMF1/EgtB/PvdO family nonheme iron enzyme [Planctomycetes bacterium]|nr:SUMF1/EgtB/PvdO family nonheme iron enzyme [Planctomycetota bacterium]